MSFSDVVEGQEKYNVARNFAALLQLVIYLTNIIEVPRLLKLRLDENWN